MTYDEMLRAWGYKPNHRGMRMLSYAAEYTADKDLEVTMTKEVYPVTARQFGTNAAAVEHNMRYAARKAGDNRTVGEIVADLALRGTKSAR